ncbi:hypothetical protein EIN_430380 [Entamoeba invadens IP1]|uniref:Uncharacterized protein n=1 Tax=Entamoeba invadens IP1 TaxID=370355 RepID=A0A0A1UHF5_ENTIV|nr:hypothetical protein EIN_430380 [Entamoeba invadens IP1]ELP95232.1 hypothetical protein EIN_430380 [Entamoeba invadens IP1]|eukprot:XP_004262003.1 hypothetical protein EIN_430380 [Entamoeba invadens IP1]
MEEEEQIFINFRCAIIDGMFMGMPMFHVVKMMRNMKKLVETIVEEEGKYKATYSSKTVSNLNLIFDFDNSQCLTRVTVLNPSIKKTKEKYYISSSGKGVVEDFKFDLTKNPEIIMKQNGQYIQEIQMSSDNQVIQPTKLIEFPSSKDVLVKDNVLSFAIGDNVDKSHLAIGATVSEVRSIFGDTQNVSRQDGIVIWEYFDRGIEVLFNTLFVVIGYVLHTNDISDDCFNVFAQCHWFICSNDKRVISYRDDWSSQEKSYTFALEKTDFENKFYSLENMKGMRFLVKKDRIMKILVTAPK